MTGKAGPVFLTKNRNSGPGPPQAKRPRLQKFLIDAKPLAICANCGRPLPAVDRTKGGRPTLTCGQLCKSRRDQRSRILKCRDRWHRNATARGDHELAAEIAAGTAAMRKGASSAPSLSQSLQDRLYREHQALWRTVLRMKERESEPKMNPYAAYNELQRVAHERARLVGCDTSATRRRLRKAPHGC
jgi:hypothetical protein